ncbi:unnamed protein product [Gongylonema pulchrum]|uniref:ECR1_N domain-containing protein n=1 Tax=Gongylonema pulchrum TaxID=637853 RepID=A0A183EB39_9BILA|nr:unnamed protein product [Gongylonema pulchrum]
MMMNNGSSDILFEEDEGEVLGWKVVSGAYVQPDGVLLVYSTQRFAEKHLRTAMAGVVTVDPNIKKGTVISISVCAKELIARNHNYIRVLIVCLL